MGIICTGFFTTARLTAAAQGVPGIRLVEYPPPNIATQGIPEIKKYAEALSGKVIEALTANGADSPETAQQFTEHAPRDIVSKGNLDEVNDFFYANRWTDGLPIIPPTVAKIEEFLRYTDRSPDEVIGKFEPSKREGTIWKVAVNGVMAGCRPEYMPVLIAIAEAIVDPLYPLIALGTTHATTPLIVINGPIIEQLDFNASISTLGPGRQANSAVGRFTRLLLINFSRFLPGLNEMAAFGWPGQFGMCLAEAERESPWESLAVERGFKPDASTVTAFCTAGLAGAFTTVGDTAEEHLRGLAGFLPRNIDHGTLARSTRYKIVVLTPLVAGIIAQGGNSKQSVKEYLFQNARLTAAEIKDMEGFYVRSVDFAKLSEEGRVLKQYHTGNDNDLLPLTHSPDEFVIVVSGNPRRNRSIALRQPRGYPVTREIKLPQKWHELTRNLNVPRHN